MGPRRLPVRWTESALGDLEVILDRVAAESPNSASNLASQILTLASNLETLPDRGRMVPERGDERVREVLLSRFRLIYESGQHAVTILGVIHQRQDFETWLLEPGRGPL